jgi:hypothetical protein
LVGDIQRYPKSLSILGYKIEVSGRLLLWLFPIGSSFLFIGIENNTIVHRRLTKALCKTIIFIQSRQIANQALLCNGSPLLTWKNEVKTGQAVLPPGSVNGSIGMLCNNCVALIMKLGFAVIKNY